MEALSDFVHEAGWGIYPVLVFGSASLLGALAYARGRNRQLLGIVVALGVLTCLFGLLGTATGLQAAVRYVGAVSPDEKWIFLVGLREALNNVVAALLIVSLDALVISTGLVRDWFAGSSRSAHAA